MVNRYDAIANDRERLERTAKNSIRTLSALYADRTHFIFELLQNAEDALRRRPDGWRGLRAVRFTLSNRWLRLSHWGKPFDDADVRAICSVGETTKELTDIGRFGIGFKSVYAFTDRPEIHSGEEDFAIEEFVRPTLIPSINRDAAETVILIPRKSVDDDFSSEIAAGLQRLGAGALLFLREIEEIEWKVEGGPSGLYLRSRPEKIGDFVRRITVIGQERGKDDVDETWLVFSRAIIEEGGRHVGYAEIAFSVTEDKKSRRETIQSGENSPLVVFFPTVVETHLGFLLQGPYRTTPSRDNVPREDSWNQRLVHETASLLLDALRWLRDQGLLNATALRCLPLDPSKFPESSMFRALFDITKRALHSEPLLPRFDGGYISAKWARLARTQELRELIAPAQLAALFDQQHELSWLSDEITQDRTPELRQYLMRELSMTEMTPETIIPKFSKAFLEAQSDEWVLRLYEFLNEQPALLRQGRLEDVPIVRLQDGTHVTAKRNSQLQAFLPSRIETDFPTVRRQVCSTMPARKFLQSLDLTEPDAVDDVVWNILPKYLGDKVTARTEDYESDIGRILKAFASDSTTQRDKLVGALTASKFVKAVKPVDGSKWWTVPGNVYLATERLKSLFDGVPEVLLVDDSYACLRGEAIRDLLETCGAIRHLRPRQESSPSWEERCNLRMQAGRAETSKYKDQVTDWTLVGLDELFDKLPQLDSEQQLTRARLLWEELDNLEERRGKGIFTGEYTWTHYGSYRTSFDAAFIRKLNTTAWVPGPDGNLEKPEFVIFETLGWKEDPYLQSKIRFKPAIIDTLAREVGIEPGVLDLLKKLGLTSEADLRAKLAKAGVVEPEQKPATTSVDDAIKNMGIGEPTPPIDDPLGPEPTPSAKGGSSAGPGAGIGSGGRHDEHADGGGGGESESEGAGEQRGARMTGNSGGRRFISYVAVHAADEEPDPDGLDQAARMALEEKAIAFILTAEPDWKRTPSHNPGFDLFKAALDGKPKRWCEVKAMTGTLRDRPIGLSVTQFSCAQEHTERYWLYVVEQAGSETGRIVRIQNPAGKARTFTFDHGWLRVADGEQQED
jgi:hypothetical protein